MESHHPPFLVTLRFFHPCLPAQHPYFILNGKDQASVSILKISINKTNFHRREDYQEPKNERRRRRKKRMHPMHWPPHSMFAFNTSEEESGDDSMWDHRTGVAFSFLFYLLKVNRTSSQNQPSWFDWQTFVLDLCCLLLTDVYIKWIGVKVWTRFSWPSLHWQKTLRYS